MWKYEVSLIMAVWSHYHLDKQNMNCRNTNTFAHYETQTSFLVASVGVMSPCLEFDNVTMCESWHPKSKRRAAWERQAAAATTSRKRRQTDRIEMCLVAPRDVQRSCLLHRISAVHGDNAHALSHRFQRL